MLPVLTYTAPHACRRRPALAPQRRSTWRASGPAPLGLKGAAFPWRTIRGQECSSYWPAGTAAFHINADIADAVDPLPVGHRRPRVRARRRRSSCWSRRHGCGARSATTTPTAHFRIDGVTGPDEYSAVADNNVYTNLMAQRNLRAAADCDRAPPASAPPSSGSTHEEVASWRDAADEMVIPYDEALGVHPQAEGFTRTRCGTSSAAGADQYPLLLHYPYFDLYRKQVVKQADLVLAHVRLRRLLHRRRRRPATSTTTSRSPSATHRCRPAPRR